ncbi:hypothetical protein AB6Q20_002182 [Salmonella enterica]
MHENTYPIEIAAELLGCQQKKIITEWAKGTIQIVLDFGPKDKITQESYHQASRNKLIKPWNAAEIYAPATQDYFPPEFFKDEPEDNHLSGWPPSCHHEYSQSGFYYDSYHSKIDCLDNDSLIIIGNALLYGLWQLPYDEFSRRQVSNIFTLYPYSDNPAINEAMALFSPGEGTRRINAPEKKNLRITGSNIEVMRKLLSSRYNNKKSQSLTSVTKEHGGVERFALGRERVLAAALYVAHHYPKDIGKSFKSHAETIEKHGYKFWKFGEAPSTHNIAKILSDTTRPPEKWKILGGNAKPKKR